MSTFFNCYLTVNHKGVEMSKLTVTKIIYVLSMLIYFALGFVLRATSFNKEAQTLQIVIELLENCKEHQVLSLPEEPCIPYDSIIKQFDKKKKMSI